MSSLSYLDIAPTVTGENLIKAMKESKTKRATIAEGLIYEQTITMIAADPGTGKSTISTQIAVELAAGLPVFGVFPVPNPVKVLYAQTERSIIEFFERLDVISKVYPINENNLYVTDEFQKLNFLNPDHATILVKCILRDCPDVKILFFDPIYSMVSGGLSADLPASAFTHALSRVQKDLKCSLWYNHHTIKPQHGQDGKAIQKHDPFYGSQWLKAHVTGSYHMSSHESGVVMTCKKDNYGLLPHTIKLEYDAETELCSIPTTELPAIERVRNFLKVKMVDKKEFSFKDIQEGTKLCTRTLRSVLLHSSISGLISVVSSKRNKNLYKIVGV